MPFDSVDRPAVEAMVKDFYGEVLKDKMLGRIFIKALGNDLKGGKWHEHHNTLYNFWMKTMTGRSPYQGHPFPPHAFLGPLTREHFERWLELFHDTVFRLFTPDIANEFYAKANFLAEEFMENLGVDDDDDDDW